MPGRKLGESAAGDEAEGEEAAPAPNEGQEGDAYTLEMLRHPRNDLAPVQCHETESD